MEQCIYFFAIYCPNIPFLYINKEKTMEYMKLVVYFL